MYSNIDIFLDSNIRKTDDGYTYDLIDTSSLFNILHNPTCDFHHWISVYTFLVRLNVKHVPMTFFGIHPSVSYQLLLMEHFDTPIIKDLLYIAFIESIRCNGFDDFIHRERVQKLSFFMNHMVMNHFGFINDFAIRYKQEQDSIYRMDMTILSTQYI